MSRRRLEAVNDIAKEALKRPRLTYENLNVTTRGATRRCLSDAVFLTTELLENVLHHLPMKDLLLAQRICRKWRTVICENKSLQQALYLVPHEPLLRWKYNETPVRRLTRVSPDTPLHTAESPEDSDVCEIATFNSLLCREDRSVDTLMKPAHEGWDSCRLSGLPSMKYPEASWRRMLITQPPIKDTHLYCYFVGDDIVNELGYEADISNRNGVTAWGIVSGTPKKNEDGVERVWQNTMIITSRLLLVSDEEWRMTDEDLMVTAHEHKPWCSF